MEKIKKALHESPVARWGILLLVGLILSVNYYFYDAFSTLKDLLMREFNFTNTHYGLFVSFYSIPNTFLLMAVLGGMILAAWLALTGQRLTRKEGLGLLAYYGIYLGALVTLTCLGRS